MLGPLNALSHRRTRPPPAIFYRLYMYPHAAYAGRLPTGEVCICEIAGDDGLRDGGLWDEGEMARGAGETGPRQGQPLVTRKAGSGQVEEHRQEGAGSPPQRSQAPRHEPHHPGLAGGSPAAWENRKLEL